MTKKILTAGVTPHSKQRAALRPATSCTPEPPDPARFPDGCPYPACHAENVEQVEQAKQEWESTADSLPQLICLLDESGRIQRANRTVEHWDLGKVAEIRGRTMHDLLHPHCHLSDCVIRNFWDTASYLTKTGKPAELQLNDTMLRRYLHLSYRSHRTNARIKQGFGVAVVADISELKNTERRLQALNQELERRVEERTFDLVTANLRLKLEIEDRKLIEGELEKSREEYRLLVDNMNEGLLVCNQRGRVTYVNDRMCDMLQRPWDEIVGLVAAEFIEPSDRAFWNNQIVEIRPGGNKPHELRLVQRQGGEMWARISPSPLLDLDGNVIGVYAVVTDISERIRAEEALRASRNRLHHLSEQVMSAQEKERKRVASELHDGIGQTLSAVKFCVETGIKHLQVNPDEKAIRQLESVVPRIQDAIEEVRRISMALRPSILDDIGIIATLTWFCRESSRIYEGMRIELQHDIEEDPIPVPIKVVIFRIVQEALNNIIKHSGADLMHISLAQRGESIELDIEDNGNGFDPKRICPGVNKSAGGLGLVSMRERAELSGATFALESSKGKGTRIRVIWPAATTGISD